MTKSKPQTPRLKSETRRLTELIGVRFSAPQRIELEKVADSLGISVPALLRQRALESLGIAS